MSQLLMPVRTEEQVEVPNSRNSSNLDRPAGGWRKTSARTIHYISFRKKKKEGWLYLDTYKNLDTQSLYAWLYRYNLSDRGDHFTSVKVSNLPTHKYCKHLSFNLLFLDTFNFYFFFFLIYCVSLFWSYLNWICYTHSFYIWTVSSSFKFVSIGVTRNQEELFYNPRAKKSINFSSAIFYLWSASFSILSLTMLIAAWISGSMGYDLETLCLMSASGKLTSVSFPILLCISCSLWVSVSLGNECLLMSLERRDFNIGRTSWEVLVSLIYRDFSGLLVYFPFFFSK